MAHLNTKMKGDYPVSSWENTRSAALKKIRDKAGDDEVLEEIAEETDPKKKAEREKNCEVIRMITDKCVENYRDGEYSYKETIEAICAALKKVK